MQVVLSGRERERLSQSLYKTNFWVGVNLFSMYVYWWYGHLGATKADIMGDFDRAITKFTLLWFSDLRKGYGVENGLDVTVIDL